MNNGKKREWLIAARKAAGLTQTQLAEAAGMTQTGYSAFETGARNPRVAAAKRIADALNKAANAPREPVPVIAWTDFYKD